MRKRKARGLGTWPGGYYLPMLAWSWSSLLFHLDLEYKDIIVGLDSTGSSLPP